MLELAGNWWMRMTSPGDSFRTVEFTVRPEREGAKVYASIALSRVSTSIVDNPNPKFNIRASVISWTTLEGGRESPSQLNPDGDVSPVAIIDNCVRVTFQMGGARVGGVALINILYL
jgi:hypothetical protein